MRIQVELGAIKRNLIKIKERIGANVALTFMVKANAYNHGVERVAPYVRNVVDAFGVATAAEGAALHLFGIENRILVTAFTERDAAEAEFYRLTPVLGTLSDVRLFARKSKDFDIALDTGMSREGLSDGEAQEAARFLNANGIAPRGIATHFADTDATRDAQLAAYEKMRAYFTGDKIKFHAAASDAALSAEKYRFDEVRIGIAGYGAVSDSGLEAAMRVTATVEFVKKVKKGSKVGYDGLYEMPTDGELAFVRAGYYDGIPRLLKGARLAVGGGYAPVAGNVSMDSFMLDVTGLDVRTGDEVEYISKRNPADRLAREIGTIPYELLTNLKGRNLREYHGETNDSERDNCGTKRKQG